MQTSSPGHGKTHAATRPHRKSDLLRPTTRVPSRNPPLATPRVRLVTSPPLAGCRAAATAGIRRDRAVSPPRCPQVHGWGRRVWLGPEAQAHVTCRQLPRTGARHA
eukprot:6836866-Prymnesium_polylepis.2